MDLYTLYMYIMYISYSSISDRLVDWLMIQSIKRPINESSDYNDAKTISQNGFLTSHPCRTGVFLQ